MDSKPTESSKPAKRGGRSAAIRRRATDAARKAATRGAKLARDKGPVVAARVGTAARRAGTAIKSPGWRARVAAFARRVVEVVCATAVAVKQKVEQWGWLKTTSKRTADLSRRAYRAGKDHIDKKGYKESLTRTIKDVPQRYPALERSWKEFMHAFALAPESSSKQSPARKTATSKKKTTGKTGRTATSTKTAAPKTTSKKKAAKKTTSKKTTSGKTASKRAA